MALVLLYDDARSQRICSASAVEISTFRQFLKTEKVFYNKSRVGALLLHHYKFLMDLAATPVPKELSAWLESDRKIPVMHCLRADIQDLCACCPWVSECKQQDCSAADCIGRLMATQLITDVYECEQRRMDKFIGAVISKSRRFFYLLQKNSRQQQNSLFDLVDLLKLKGKEEGAVAHACRTTLINYRSALKTAIS